MHPHFKRPPPQGWSRGCYTAAVLKLSKNDVNRTRGRRQRAGFDKERVRDVRTHLAALLDGVTVGSERLYDGLPARSLDGQALAIAIAAHLGRPAMPPPAELLHGLCEAAGLCVEQATESLCSVLVDLCLQADAIGTAMERSQAYWRAKLDGLPEGCHAPLSPTRRWRRRTQCRHQGGRLCLGEPPWQPKSANAAAAAPHRSRCPRRTLTARGSTSARDAAPHGGAQHSAASLGTAQ